uniref:Uncharacterized protein n=1 Tax=Helicotheca tamesis TaxID=374047 RepID=A0A7S2HB49_9STRA|mmetsp:Transcript_16752/g.22938  ORF Transcript_16752/g.22938 Transcript_16752/m.22938 type:complete len:232 (+) Transcript_16752:146-841(+)
MYFFHASIHLLLPLTLFLISPQFSQSEGDIACDDKYLAFAESLSLSNVCQEQSLDGSCTEDCTTEVSKVHEVCNGKMITGEGGEENPYSLVILIFALDAFGFVPDACVDALYDWVPSINDLPCSEWLFLDLRVGVADCSSECTDKCKAVINKVYATCNENDTVEDEDGRTITAREVEQGLTLFRDAECDEHAKSLSFEGETPTSPAYIIPTTSNHVLTAAYILSVVSFILV